MMDQQPAKPAHTNVYHVTIQRCHAHHVIKTIIDHWWAVLVNVQLATTISDSNYAYHVHPLATHARILVPSAQAVTQAPHSIELTCLSLFKHATVKMDTTMMELT
jgi:hypothetical protein